MLKVLKDHKDHKELKDLKAHKERQVHHHKVLKELKGQVEDKVLKVFQVQQAIQEPKELTEVQVHKVPKDQ